ncbi:hypothetical protein [Leptospira kobayashii]|uniref:hypothetical protein n=1 Tax=Leptospira kobayashii TaxID=1917830 RepID=UPI00107EEC71|nr:hypothetical protein [Leptospira kobayashii]
MEKYFFLIVALSTYILVLIWAVLFKVGKGDSPLTAFNQLHIRFSLFYLLVSAALFLAFYTPDLYTVFDFSIGYFFYLGFHYAIFQNFYGLAQRSISASLLILLKHNGGEMRVNDCLKNYADGKGFGYIKKSRLEDMVHLQFVSLENGVYKITSRGKKTSFVVRSILGFWGLRQLGK